MADILGVGMTHYPGLLGTDEPGSSSLARVLKHNTRIPEEKKDPRSWPEAMRLECGFSKEYSTIPDPPGPSPKRCMEVGAATVRALQDTPWRVAMIASSSWSHAFLTEKTHWLHPDMEADRARFEEFRIADWEPGGG